MTTHRPFGRRLRDLLIANDVTTRNGNPDWADFCQQLDGISYETLRKAVTAERAPTTKIIEAVSDTLSVEPDRFVERLLQAQRRFDWREVGFEDAVANLRLWESRLGGATRAVWAETGEDDQRNYENNR
jgi:hypothetical protein